MIYYNHPEREIIKEVNDMNVKKFFEDGWNEYVKYCEIKSRAYYC